MYKTTLYSSCSISYIMFNMWNVHVLFSNSGVESFPTHNYPYMANLLDSAGTCNSRDLFYVIDDGNKLEIN